MAKTKFRLFALALTLILISLSCRSEQNPLFQPKAENADAEEGANLIALLQNSPNPFTSSTLIRFGKICGSSRAEQQYISLTF